MSNQEERNVRRGGTEGGGDSEGWVDSVGEGDSREIMRKASALNCTLGWAE